MSRTTPPSSSTRLALVVTLTSLLLCLGLRAVIVPCHPFGDLSGGGFSDHFSHMNAARLFCRVGLDIWRRPIKSQLPEVTPEEKSRLPADLQDPEMYREVEVYR